MGFPWWVNSKEAACQSRDMEFDPGREDPHALDKLGCCAQLLSLYLPKLLKHRVPRVHAQQQEKPEWELQTPQLEVAPAREKLEKSPHSKQDPAQAKYAYKL